MKRALLNGDADLGTWTIDCIVGIIDCIWSNLGMEPDISYTAVADVT